MPLYTEEELSERVAAAVVEAQRNLVSRAKEMVAGLQPVSSIAKEK